MSAPGDEKLSSNLLWKVDPPASITSVRALHRRAAAFRMALSGRGAAAGDVGKKDKKGGKASPEGGGAGLPKPITKAWAQLLCDVHLLLSPNSPNEWVRNGVLRFSTGDPVSDTRPVLSS